MEKMTHVAYILSVCNSNTNVLFIILEFALAERQLSNRKNTKRIYQSFYEIKNLSYTDRLHALNELTLLRRRKLAGMLLLFKCLHSHINVLHEKLSLVKVAFVIRGQGL